MGLTQLGDPFVPSFHQLIQWLQVIPRQLQLKAVMLAHLAAQSASPLRNLTPQAAPGHFRQHFRVLLAAEQGPDHVRPDAPSISLATEPSLMWVSSRIL